MKLSLRGFDPDADRFVLTRQALARRVDLTKPDRQPDAEEGDAQPCRTAAARGSTRTRRTTTSCSTGSRPARRARRTPTRRLERLEVFPRGRRLLKPKDKLPRRSSRAVYSDGTTEDVTRWAQVRVERGAGRAP